MDIDIDNTNVIHDTQNVMVEKGLEVDGSGNTVMLTEEDYKEVLKRVKRLKQYKEDSSENLVFIFRGSNYKLSREFSKIFLPNKENTTCELNLKFHKGKNTVDLTYCIFRHSTSGIPSISITGNPTTLINGHNTSPLLLSDDAYQDLKLYYQIPFLFLFEVLDFKPSLELKDNIKRCIIQANNVQWAMYLPCNNKIRTLNALDLIYGRQDIKVTDKNRIKILCNYLGFKYAKDQSKYEGFMISKYHANGDNVLTINLYDKTQSNKDHKISGLTVEEKHVTDNSLRLDITAHKTFLIQMINAAKDIARVYIKEGVNSKYFSIKALQKFIDSQDSRAWACNMVMAMLLLSLKKNKEGKLVKSSFSAWLKHKILIDMMKLDLLLKFSGSIDTSTLTEAEKDVFRDWKDEQYIEQERKSTLYRMEDKLGISTKLPYRMLKAIIMLDSVQGLDDKDSDRYIELLSKSKKHGLSIKELKELEKLQVKSSHNIMQSRIEMAETFGIPLMPPVSDKRHLLASV